MATNQISFKKWTSLNGPLTYFSKTSISSYPFYNNSVAYIVPSS